MRVVLKPGGLFVLISSILLLALVAIFNGRWNIANRNADYPLPGPPAKKDSIRIAADGDRGKIAGGALNLTPSSLRYASVAPIPATQLPAGAEDAVRISVHSKPEGAQRVEIHHAIRGSMNEETTLHLHFWAEFLDQENRYAVPTNRVKVIVGRKGRIDTGSFVVTITPSVHWKEYDYYFSGPSWASGEGELQYQFGDVAGHLDIAGLSLR